MIHKRVWFFALVSTPTELYCREDHAPWLYRNTHFSNSDKNTELSLTSLVSSSIAVENTYQDIVLPLFCHCKARFIPEGNSVRYHLLCRPQNPASTLQLGSPSTLDFRLSSTCQLSYLSCSVL